MVIITGSIFIFLDNYRALFNIIHIRHHHSRILSSGICKGDLAESINIYHKTLKQSIEALLNNNYKLM
jgi:hypothetical protein